MRHLRRAPPPRPRRTVHLIQAADLGLVGEQDVHFAGHQFAESGAMAVDAECVRQRQRHLAPGGVGRSGSAAERGLCGRRIEQVALQIQHGRLGHQSLVHIRLAERDAGAEDTCSWCAARPASPGSGSVPSAAPPVQRRGGEMHARRGDVAPERLAQMRHPPPCPDRRRGRPGRPPRRRCWRPSRRCSPPQAASRHTARSAAASSISAMPALAHVVLG